MAKKPAPAPKPNTPPAAAAATASADLAAPNAAEALKATGKAAAAAADAVTVFGLRITAKREGFRRAGRAWSKTPTEVPLADLEEYQANLLRAEHGHMLTVEEIDLP